MLTVCIVEDQAPIRERISRRLAGMSMVEVLGAFDSGTAALEGLPRLRPALTIMDIGLPGMSGTEVVARLYAAEYPGDFVMFTVFEHDDHLFRALELGAAGYLLKGDGAAGVERAVDEYRRGGAPMSRAIAQRVLESFRRPPQVRLTAKLEELTPQQNRVLELIAEGLLNKEIADRLDVTEATIKQHNVRIYRKLAVNNRAEAIRAYLSR